MSILQKSQFGLESVPLKSLELTVLNGADTGTLTFSEAVDVISILPKTNGSAIKSYALNRATNVLTVVLVTATTGDAVFEIIHI